MTSKTKEQGARPSVAPGRERTYRGRRGAEGARVLVGEGDVERPLAHHVRHSPGGFSWGYAGSGPAELARCMLIDFFGPAAVCPECREGWIETEEGRERCWHCGGEAFRLPVSYQDFKFEFIAPLTQDEDWEIGGSEIEDWVRARQVADPSGQPRGGRS